MNSKRKVSGAADGVDSKRVPHKSRAKDNSDLKFEDDFEDEVDEEDELMRDTRKKTEGLMQEGLEEEEEEDETMDEAPRRLFRPWVDQVGEDEQLEYDNSAYTMLHQMRVEFPFLSFDFFRDSLGEQRLKFPKTAFMVGGTQADDPSKHKLSVIKMSEMHKTKKDKLEEDLSDSDSDSDSDDGLDDDATIESRDVKHTGAVNRVRAMPQQPGIVASWSDAGRVYMWDLRRELASLGAIPSTEAVMGGAVGGETKPTFAFRGHKDEGFALDWSPKKAGRMVSGDCRKSIFLWQVTPSGDCAVDDTSFTGHSKSVEDLQWSPNEETVFASCSVDRSIRIWDVRERKKSCKAIENAHKDDVNVIAWNKNVPHLLASGSDDGAIKVWDLMQLKKLPDGETLQPVGHFLWHQGPITSIEWHPHDPTVLVASGADNQVSVWDFGLEEDPEEANVAPKLQSEVLDSKGEKLVIPPQLLFLHQGQNDLKEVHFHPQINGMIGSTAADGFHVFIPEPLDPKMLKKAEESKMTV